MDAVEDRTKHTSIDLRQLIERIADQTLLLEFSHSRERRLHRPLGRSMSVEHTAHIDDIEHVHTKIPEIVVNGLGDVLT